MAAGPGARSIAGAKLNVGGGPAAGVRPMAGVPMNTGARLAACGGAWSASQLQP